jgi:RES domain-containing protein
LIFWMISRHLDLSGTGGLRLPGRWHDIGHPVVYLATTPAAALLEVCVHTSANDVPPSYTLLKVSAPDDLTILQIDASQLPEDWQNRLDLTCDLGTDWLKKGSTALLEVPSAIVPETRNILLNPLDPEAAQCAIVATQSYAFDFRLKR